MIIQNTSANIKIKIQSEEANLLEAANKVLVNFSRRDHKFCKEAIIINPEEQIAICYLTAKDLCMPGNYDYNIEVHIGKKVVKSGMGSFYVNPAVSCNC